jgi:hypothetical protein
LCHGATTHLETCAARSAMCSLPGSTARGATVSLRPSGLTKPTPQGTIVSKCCELHLGPPCAGTSKGSLQLCDKLQIMYLAGHHNAAREGQWPCTCSTGWSVG